MIHFLIQLDFGLARETTTVSLDAVSSVQVYQSVKSLYGEDVKMPIFIMAPESLQENVNQLALPSHINRFTQR